MAMASLLSVTVSMAAETMGTLIESFLVKRVCVETSRGNTSEYFGKTKTSSKVKP